MQNSKDRSNVFFAVRRYARAVCFLLQVATIAIFVKTAERIELVSEFFFVMTLLSARATYVLPQKKIRYFPYFFGVFVTPFTRVDNQRDCHNFVYDT